MPLVSVLIPAYNAAQTIEATIRSLACQQPDDFEVVIVNDGSADATREILGRMQTEFPFVRVIEQENVGVSLTRQRLIQEAKGEYILFCDADDCMMPHAMETVFGAIHEHQTASLFVFGYDLVRSDGTKRVLHRGIEAGVVDRDTYAAHHVRGLSDLYFSVLWNKCYKRALFFDPHELIFEPLMEDILFNIDYMARCEQIAVIWQCIYCYYQMNASMTRGTAQDSVCAVREALNTVLVLREKAVQTYPAQQRAIAGDVYMKLHVLKSRAAKLGDTALAEEVRASMRACRKALGISYVSVLWSMCKSKAKRMIKRIKR